MMLTLEQLRTDFVRQVYVLSQEEGMRDKEIAEILQCSRATVNRARKTHQIPTANLSNRRDKECSCDTCGNLFMIRRRERVKHKCLNCEAKEAAAVTESIEPADYIH